MEIILNGEKQQLADGLSVAGLLKEMGTNEEMVSVELNGKVLSRDEYTAPLKAGDRINVLHFMGGGL